MGECSIPLGGSGDLASCQVAPGPLVSREELSTEVGRPKRCIEATTLRPFVRELIVVA